MFSISKRPTIQEIHDLYREKKALPSQIISFFLNRIAQTDKEIVAFYEVLNESANQKALELDKILQTQDTTPDWFEKLIEKQPLFGIPFSLKSLILAQGHEFNGSSNILRNYKAPYSSTVFLKLDQAGAILIGLNVNDQFGHGASGENSDLGISKNPFDKTRVAGGSSSGSVAAVASGQVVFSIGTDTGGSIRQPAAFTDTTSIKPTYGVVSRYGVMAMASSFDQASPVSNNVRDTLTVFNIIAGQDQMDQTSIDSSQVKTEIDQILHTKTIAKKLKIGIPKEFYTDGIHSKIKAKLENLQKALQASGHELVPVSIPMVKYAVSVYYITMPVELASNLERLDGVRYAVQEDNYTEKYFSHRAYFGEESKRRIMLGTYVSSAGYYDAYYNKAQKVREKARQEFEEVLNQVDVLLTPTTPEFPFKLGDKTQDPLQMYLSDVFTCGVNPVRIPSMNISLGLIPVDTENGVVELPTGCQVMSRELAEPMIAKLALEIENLKLKNKF